MKVCIIGLLLLIIISGCAQVQNKTDNEVSPLPVVNIQVSKVPFVSVAPYTSPHGNRVFIRITTPPDKDLKIAVNNLREEVFAWLSTKGFKAVNEARKADTILTVDIHDLKSEDNTVIAMLALGMYSQIHGTPTILFSHGGLGLPNQNIEIFNDVRVAKRIVAETLSSSPFGAIEEVPEVSDNEKDPGCWPKLGILFVENEKLDRGERIREFRQDSLAQKSGLKVGDIVLSIAGINLPYDEQIPLKADQLVPVLALKNHKEVHLKVAPAMICEGDEWNE